MKGIAIKELITILQLLENNYEIMTQDHINSLFENLGDDYFRDYGISSWELCKENKDRKTLIEKLDK